jgi:ATP-dependent RNA helicase DeaD
MGREGVAYTFVTPEQGIELTRIEVLINKLLERDEIDGFQAVVQAAPKQTPEDDAAPRDNDAEEEKKDPPPPPPPGKRPRRRHRRGL